MFISHDHANAEGSDQSVKFTASDNCRIDTDGDLQWNNSA